MHSTEQQLQSAMVDSLEKGAELLTKMAEAVSEEVRAPGKKINLTKLMELANGPRTDS